MYIGLLLNYCITYMKVKSEGNVIIAIYSSFLNWNMPKGLLPQRTPGDLRLSIYHHGTCFQEMKTTLSHVARRNITAQ
jgi:hypothetical protein